MCITELSIQIMFVVDDKTILTTITNEKKKHLMRLFTELVTFLFERDQTAKKQLKRWKFSEHL